MTIDILDTDLFKLNFFSIEIIMELICAWHICRIDCYNTEEIPSV